MSNGITEYNTRMIRAGFEAADVNMFGALCNAAKIDKDNSRQYMYVLLDIAQQNGDDVIAVVKMGRELSGEKVINDKFMCAVYNAVSSDGEDEDDVTINVPRTPTARVLDLTADDDDDSGSYETTGEDHEDRPSSKDAYEIDGFVVEEDEGQDLEASPMKPMKRNRTRVIKRFRSKLSSIQE